MKVADLVGCKEIWCRAWDEVRRVLFCVCIPPFLQNHPNSSASELSLSHSRFYADNKYKSLLGEGEVLWCLRGLSDHCHSPLEVEWCSGPGPLPPPPPISVWHVLDRWIPDGPERGHGIEEMLINQCDYHNFFTFADPHESGHRQKRRVHYTSRGGLSSCI